MPTPKQFRITLAVLLSVVGVCIVLFPLGTSRIVGAMAFLVGLLAIRHVAQPASAGPLAPEEVLAARILMLRALSGALTREASLDPPLPLAEHHDRNFPSGEPLRVYVPLAAARAFLFAADTVGDESRGAAYRGIDQLFQALIDDPSTHEAALLYAGTALDALLMPGPEGTAPSEVLACLHASGAYWRGGTRYTLVSLPPFVLSSVAAFGFQRRTALLTEGGDVNDAEAFAITCAVEDILSFVRDGDGEAPMHALRSSPGYPKLLAGFTSIPAATAGGTV